MAGKALQVALVNDSSFQETPEALRFKQLTNCDLTVFGSNPSETVIRKALEYVNSEVFRKLEVEKDTISRVVGAFPGYFESDAQSFSAQFASVRGFSGTPWNHAAYPEKLRDSLYLDQETEGRIIDQCLQKETKDSVRIIQEPTIENLLQKISPNAMGLIDSSGMLKKLDTETAARQILAYHKDNVKIQTVLFFSKDGAPSALKKTPKGDPELIHIGSTQKAEIQKHDIDPKSTFVYYDECHTEATDIFQSPEAMNAILIDHKTTLRTCLQGILRLRNFFNKQSVEYVIADNEKHHFAKKEGVITVSHIMEKGVENQAKQIVQEEGKAYKQKIDCIFKEALFQLALKEGDLKSYDTFFVQTSDQVYPHNLAEYRDVQEEKFKNLVKDQKLQGVVSKQLDTLMEKIKSEATNTELYNFIRLCQIKKLSLLYRYFPATMSTLIQLIKHYETIHSSLSKISPSKTL